MAYIVSPFTTFADTDGTPLNNGYVYIGTENLNPVTNPISVYWDEALTQSAAQPLRTLNGFFSRSGTPARVYTGATNFSMVVNNDKGELVYSSASISGDVSQADFVAFQASVNAAVAAKLNLSGGTMTGPIVLPGAPSAALEAANKGYVDTQDALKVNKAGDTMTGKLNVAATGIGFSDLSTQTTAGVAKTGDTMTGALTLPGSPTLNLQAATKQYVDSTAATGSPVKAWVSFSGLTPTGGQYPIRGAYNVTSVTDQSTGVYNVNFTSSLIDVNYSVALGATRANDTATSGLAPKSINKTTNSFQIVTYSGSGPLDYFMVDCVVCR